MKTPTSATAIIATWKSSPAIREQFKTITAYEAACNADKSWKSSPAIRAEFRTLDAYRSYCCAAVTGKARIIGAQA